MRNDRTITYTIGEHPKYDREVYFLKFSYSEELKEEIKAIIGSLRSEFSSRTFRPSHQAGGWIADPKYKCWFVDPSIWRSFRDSLEYEGYSLYDAEEDQEDYEQDHHQHHQHHQHHRQNSNQEQGNKHNQANTSPVKVNIFTSWLKISSDNQVGLHAAYKDLCLLLHPDRQTNEKLRTIADDLMKRVNSDFDEFRKAKAS